MNRYPRPIQRYLPHILTALAFGSYAVIFASYHNELGTGAASLATIPVVVAGWYFGIRGGIVTALLAIVVSGYLQSSDGRSALDLFIDPSTIVREISLLLVAVVTGRLSHITQERMDAVRRFELYESQRQSHTRFLELLNSITSKALEADNLQSTLEILTEQIARLFSADDGYLAFWDAEKKVPIPKVAYGPMKESYPHTVFEPGERTLTSSVLEAGAPVPVLDVKNSPHISPRIASLFPSHSMLGVPLIAQERKLGVLMLGYNRSREFNAEEIAYAGMMAEQFALVLSKSQLLEEERKQVRQLTALHDVALTSIEADDEDQLIERVTEIIGRNLFSDNFGIMLLAESTELLHAHPSYRFNTNEKIGLREVPIGKGITGEVAKTGKPQRLGNVRLNPQYLDVDDRIISELCVPIKFKERILGVINAESAEKDAFTPDDERLMVTLAGQLATAIEQLRKSQAERNWLEQLAHSNDLIYAIAQITARLETILTMEEIIQQLGVELQKIDLTCIMAIHDPDSETFTFNYTSLPSEHLLLVERGLGYPMLQYSFPRTALMKDLLQPAAITNPENEIESLFTNTERPGVSRILQEIGVSPGMEPLRLPLIVEDNLLGILWIWGKGIRKSDLPILSIFSKQVGVSLERVRLFQEVQSLALTDPLTGLHNRRGLFELGRIEFSRASRLKRACSCLMLDLDNFKHINDTHGHPTGDLMLQEFANLCKKSVRDIDLVARYGGEEMIILMPETERETAILAAERLRSFTAAKEIIVGSHLMNITVSIGVATTDENTTDLETLIARADQAMYIAKHRGRNRVAVSK